MELLFENKINNKQNDIMLNDIHNYFKLPIYYIKDKVELSENINDDLELYSTNEEDNENKLYSNVFTPDSIYGKNMMSEWGKYYTYDVDFLKESQFLIKNINNSSIKPCSELKCWDDIKKETSFKERYHYVDWYYFRRFNESSTFLQILSMYNMSSPILSLIIPIILLILPLFILKLQGITISFSKYYDLLKMLFSNHSLGKLFTDFGSISWSKRFYILLSIGFYFFQIYQNILTCIRFHTNLKLITNHFHEIKAYLNATIENYNSFLYLTQNLKSYRDFNEKIQINCEIFNNLKKSLDHIHNYNYKTYLNVGYLMKWFYIFYYNNEINNSFLFSFGFNGYLENLIHVNQSIQNKDLGICKFNIKNKVSFKNAYYAPLVNKNPVRNSYSVNKNMSVTGPNASGKTTLLKTTLFNIILSQQLGCGFYKSANIMPYHYLHCYLNIPDTSGRDSLFQAEARRCKEIISKLDITSNQNRHFCIFDELYSGTNPYEAVASAFSFIKYLNNKNVDFMLTTHFINLCISLEREELCENYKMDILILKNKEFSYTYKMISGISKIKGGVKVLKDLEYPKKIIEETEIYLENN